MECKWGVEQSAGGVVKIEGNSIKKVGEYEYLGALVQENREINKDVDSRMQVGWRKWREAKGVLCDKRVPRRVKGKFMQQWLDQR